MTSGGLHVWWCNQSRSWRREFAAGAVSASSDTTQLRFRRMVAEARPGDVVVHYRSSRGVVAVSRVETVPIACAARDPRAICVQGKGWAFATEYRLLTPPISLPLRRLNELRIPDGPLQRSFGKPRIRRAYFMPFSLRGLRVIVGAAPDRDWPEWVREALGSHERVRKAQMAAGPVRAIEGLVTEARILTRSRNRALRDRALAASKSVCGVCGRDFSALLDGNGVCALQVHHLKQLAVSDVPRVTGLRDLAVVCATCHSLIHADRQRAMPVSVLRRKLLKDRYVVR